MMVGTSQIRGLPGEPRPDASESSDGRLECWKEIAGYLRRSVRSARRWEKDEGLPVHRHLHDKRDSVYAYRAELDGWWESRGTKLADQDVARENAPVPEEARPAEAPARVGSSEPAGEIPPAQKAKRTAALVALGLLVVLLSAAVWMSNRKPLGASETPSDSFQARDWILVAGFENQTGDPALDEMVDYALERELSNSRSENVVPQERVLDVLKLMRKPPDIRVDAALGREICLRDGIRTLLTGRIEKAASRYHLSIIVVDPRTGATVASITEQAAGNLQLHAAVRRGSQRVLEIFREAPALVTASEVKLVKITTPSLLALRLYSRADELIAEGKYPAAEELLKHAVAEDPEFASAHIQLAWAIRNQGKPREKFLPAAMTAYRLSDSTSERERYFIRGSYFDLSGSREEAVAAYEALLSLARGRTAEAIDELKKNQERISAFGRGSLFLAAEILASTLDRQGDEEGAVRALEQASLQERPVFSLWMSNGGFRTRNQFLLARLYRKVGRVAEAERIEIELTKLLAVADSDRPILVALERLQARPDRDQRGAPRPLVFRTPAPGLTSSRMGSRDFLRALP